MTDDANGILAKLNAEIEYARQEFISLGINELSVRGNPLELTIRETCRSMLDQMFSAEQERDELRESLSKALVELDWCKDRLAKISRQDGGTGP
jgi:hypothetical protein